jgi:hypothetical protein
MWFSTHWLHSVRFKDGLQQTFPVLERVVLIEAVDDEEARKKASLMARQEQEETGGNCHWAGGRPAIKEFIGVRKTIIVSIEEGDVEVKFAEGQELTCWEYEVRGEEELRKLIDGERLPVDYIE